MTALYWFNNDLRIEDNSLLTKLAQESKSLHCCFIIDPQWFNSSSLLKSAMGLNRWNFLKQSLKELAKALHNRNIELQVLYGKPENILPKLVDELAIDTLGCGRQVGYQEKQSLKAIQNKLPGLTFKTAWLNTLFTEDFIVNSNAVFGSFSKFRKVAEKHLIKINIEPSSSDWQCHDKGLQPINTTENASLHNAITVVDNLFPSQAPHNKTVNEIIIKGGCDVASRHLTDYFLSGAADHYKQTRNDLDGLRRSTLFSPWLALGCLSVKKVWQTISDYEQRYQANESTYWIKLELLWREYFQWLALAQGRHLFTFKGSAKAAPNTTFHQERFQQWSTGKTKYPLVNALMKQLNSTGFMSNRGRQIVASCLVNELALDWRYGASYFEKQLIDYDVASNWGNWQYIAGVGADPKGGRWFNIEKQRQYFDPDGEFIAKWQGNKQLTPIPLAHNANIKDGECDVN
jgi:deoxyribodipyrimidine photo-lyase